MIPEKVPDQDFEAKAAEERLKKETEKELAAFKGPAVSRSGSAISIRWPGRGITFQFNSMKEDGRGITGELEVISDAMGRLTWGACGLLALASQEILIKKLALKLPLENRVDWPDLVERSFHLCGETFRRGEPVILLDPNAQKQDCGFAINPIMPKGEVSFIFADGGSGKSYMSLFLAVSFSLGISLPNNLFAHGPGNVLILDWESTQHEVSHRLTRICSGLGVAFPKIAYRNMSRYLDDEIERVRKEIIERNVGMVIVDSWQPACGSSDSGDPASRTVSTITALRSLGVSTLAIAHLSKADVSAGGSGNKIYGSVFTWNLARSIWELRGTQDDGSDAINIGLYHRKCNAGKLRQPMGFQIAFDSGTVCLHGLDLFKDPDLMKAMSVPYKITEALKRGSFTAEELADSIGAPLSTVRVRLTEMKHRGRIIEIKREGKIITWGIKQT